MLSLSFFMIAKYCTRVVLILPCCFMLAACSTGVDSITYLVPSMPPSKRRSGASKAAASEAKLTPPLEMSDLRETYHGPGRFFLCMRGLEPKSNRTVTYTVFFDNNDYKGSRLPAILD
jgi:hypothetical protein